MQRVRIQQKFLQKYKNEKRMNRLNKNRERTQSISKSKSQSIQNSPKQLSKSNSNSNNTNETPKSSENQEKRTMEEKNDNNVETSETKENNESNNATPIITEESKENDTNNNNNANTINSKPNEQNPNKLVKSPSKSKHTVKKIKLKIRKGKFGWCMVCDAPSNHYCIQTKDSVCSLECKLANLLNVINDLEMKFENINNNDNKNEIIEKKSDLIEHSNNKTIERLKVAYKLGILTSDGHLLFRLLCRQSWRELPMDNYNLDPNNRYSIGSNASSNGTSYYTNHSAASSGSSSSWFDWKIPRLFDPQSQMKV